MFRSKYLYGGRSPPYEHYWFMGSIRDRCSVVGSFHEPAAGGRTDFPSPTGRRRSEGPGEGETARFMGTIRGRNAARRSLPDGLSRHLVLRQHDRGNPDPICNSCPNLQQSYPIILEK